jgi:hypothetical protein
MICTKWLAADNHQLFANHSLQMDLLISSRFDCAVSKVIKKGGIFLAVLEQRKIVQLSGGAAGY